MTPAEKVAIQNDPVVNAFATTAFHLAKQCYSATASDPSQSEHKLKDDLLFLFFGFNRHRNAEVAYLREEVIRLRMLVTEPMPTGMVLESRRK